MSLFVDILFYDPDTLVGKSTQRCNKRALKDLPDPFVLLPETALEADPREWVADTVAGTARKVQRAMTAQDVDAERDRRITGGFMFKRRPIQSDPESMRRIEAAAASASRSLLMNGSENDYFTDWVCADNTQLTLTIRRMLRLADVAATHERRALRAARALKDEQHVPNDFKDDKYW